MILRSGGAEERSEESHVSWQAMRCFLHISFTTNTISASNIIIDMSREYSLNFYIIITAAVTLLLINYHNDQNRFEKWPIVSMIVDSVKKSAINASGSIHVTHHHPMHFKRRFFLLNSWKCLPIWVSWDHFPVSVFNEAVGTSARQRHSLVFIYTKR